MELFKDEFVWNSFLLHHLVWKVEQFMLTVARNDLLSDILRRIVCSKASGTPATATAATLSTVTYPYSSTCIMGTYLGRCMPESSSAIYNFAFCWRRQPTDEQQAELITNKNENDAKESFIFRVIKFKRKQKRSQFIEKFWERQDLNYAKLACGNGNDSISDIQLQHLDVYNLLNSNTVARESVYNNHTRQNAVSNSRASSSLDLEWEHEFSHLRIFQQSCVPQVELATQLPTAHNNQYTPTLIDSWQYLNNDEDQLNSLKCSEDESVQSTTPAIAIHTRAERSAMRARHSHQQQRNTTFTRTSSHTSWSHISTPESLEWDIDEEQQRQLRMEDDNLDHETLQLLHQIEQLKNQVLNETGDGLLEANGADVKFGQVPQSAKTVNIS